MATSKTTTVSYQQKNNGSLAAVSLGSVTSLTVEPVVVDGRLVADTQFTNPGIFTEGTPKGGSVLPMDSNA